MATLLERAERIRTQKLSDKNKLYALHAPEVECISKGKARKRYEFGVKVSLVVTHLRGLMVGARSFTGNPYDAHTLFQFYFINEVIRELTIQSQDTIVRTVSGLFSKVFSPSTS